MATQQPTHNRKVAVIGLGYVGLPVAVAFGQNFRTIGFDVNEQRVNSLKDGIDITGEVEPEKLKSADVLYTNNYEELKQADFFIVAVPTPIDDSNQPNLTAMKRASESVAKVLKKGDIVVYESTVYPGATEEICVPILEEVSGLTFNVDFFAGYSPERVNPGDKEHRVTTIQKVTSGSTPEVADKIDALYASIITAGTYKAGSIKIAEAAKVIENTQRDINIALINELALIFNRLGIDTEEAEEKFGFLLQAFRYGAPPHGGIALGLDRLIMILSKARSLRDVIAFPKNQRAQSMMDDAPAAVEMKQLDELHIKLKRIQE